MNKSHFAAITLALSACFGAVQAAPVFADDESDFCDPVMVVVR